MVLPPYSSLVANTPMDEIIEFFTRRPLAQRAFLAFPVAMFVACAARIAAHS